MGKIWNTVTFKNISEHIHVIADNEEKAIHSVSCTTTTTTTNTDISGKNKKSGKSKLFHMQHVVSEKWTQILMLLRA